MPNVNPLRIPSVAEPPPVMTTLFFGSWLIGCFHFDELPYNLFVFTGQMCVTWDGQVIKNHVITLMSCYTSDLQFWGWFQCSMGGI